MPGALRKNYNFADNVLLTIGDTAWDLCLLHQPLFVAASGKYTVPFITAQKAAVLAARNMPDKAARIQNRKDLRRLMELDAEKLSSMILFFRIYISNAISDPVLRDAALAAMGDGYYTAAMRGDWESMKSLFTSAIAYGTANSVLLLGAGDMPATFMADLAALSTDFTTHYTDFLAESNAIPVATQTRRLAFNAINTEVTKMFEIAQLLPLSPADKQQFSVTYQRQLISGGATGTRGRVIAQATGLGVPFARLEIVAKGVIVFTDVNGYYELHTDAGMHQVLISVPSTSITPPFVTIEQTIFVKKNTMSKKSFILLQ